MSKKYNKPEVAQNSKKYEKGTAHNADDLSKKKKIPEKLDMLDSIDRFFQKHQQKIFIISLILTFIVSIILFNFQISIAGDDSAYIVRASDFVKHFKYPSYQGPLYPIILSPFIFLFGINIIILKGLSVVFMLGVIWLFYKSFKDRISPFILASTLILLSINHFLLYFSSQTYNEAFFLFVQGIFFYVFFKLFIEKEKPSSRKEDYKRHILLAVCLLMLGLSKNIGNVGFGIVLFYFIIQSQWKNLLYITISFAVVFILFQGIKYMLWSDSGLQIASQGSGLMYKNYYDPTAGTETLSGFIDRLITNSNTYISCSFLAMLGFRPEVPASENIPFLTVIYYMLIVTGILLVLRKNKYLLFTGLYVFFFLVTIFIILQTTWSQLRLIIPVFPLMLLFLLSTFYYLAKTKYFAKYKIIVLLFPIIILATTADQTKEENHKIPHSLDVYEGLTPDWVSYIQASKWSDENLPKETVIACRKPTISFIYGNGRHFFGINHVPSYPVATLTDEWSNLKDKYIAVNTNDFNNVSYNFFYKSRLNENIKAIVKQDKGIFFVFEKPLEAEKFYKVLNSLTDKQVHEAGIFKTLLDNSAEIYYPDSLVEHLCRSKIEYILDASLRANIEKKGDIVNTINRYMEYVSIRYPNLFSEVMKFGDDEPTKLVKVNYENYNLPFCK